MQINNTAQDIYMYINSKLILKYWFVCSLIKENKHFTDPYMYFIFLYNEYIVTS